MHTFIVCFFLGVVNDQASFVAEYVPAFERLTKAYSRIELDATIRRFENGTPIDCTAGRCLLFDENEQLTLGPCDAKTPTYMVNAEGVPETSVHNYTSTGFFALSKPISADKFSIDIIKPISKTSRSLLDKVLWGSFLPISAPFGRFGFLAGQICRSPNFSATSVASQPDGKVRVDFRYITDQKMNIVGYWIFDLTNDWVIVEQEVLGANAAGLSHSTSSLIRCHYDGKIDGVPKLVRVEEFGRTAKPANENRYTTIDITRLIPLKTAEAFNINKFDIEK